MTWALAQSVHIQNDGSVRLVDSFHQIRQRRSQGVQLETRFADLGRE